MEYNFQANGITDENKKKSIFFIIIGPLSLKLLRNLVSPNKPHEKTLQQLITLLKQHYNPTPLVIVQRFKFHTKTRKPSESIATFMSQLRSIAEFCNFGNMLEDMLRDRLVCGIADNVIQKKLLAEDPLSLAKALEIAKRMESAAKNSLLSIQIIKVSAPRG